MASSRQNKKLNQSLQVLMDYFMRKNLQDQDFAGRRELINLEGQKTMDYVDASSKANQALVEKQTAGNIEYSYWATVHSLANDDAVKQNTGMAFLARERGDMEGFNRYTEAARQRSHEIAPALWKASNVSEELSLDDFHKLIEGMGGDVAADISKEGAQTGRLKLGMIDSELNRQRDREGFQVRREENAVEHFKAQIDFAKAGQADRKEFASAVGGTIDYLEALRPKDATTGKLGQQSPLDTSIRALHEIRNAVLLNKEVTPEMTLAMENIVEYWSTYEKRSNVPGVGSISGSSMSIANTGGRGDAGYLQDVAAMWESMLPEHLKMLAPVMALKFSQDRLKMTDEEVRKILAPAVRERDRAGLYEMTKEEKEAMEASNPAYYKEAKDAKGVRGPYSAVRWRK